MSNVANVSCFIRMSTYDSVPTTKISSIDSSVSIMKRSFCQVSVSRKRTGVSVAVVYQFR